MSGAHHRAAAFAGVVGILLSMLFCVPGYAADTPQRPNIVVILADDLGYADVGFHGCRDVATPHLDALARHGVRCSSGYVSGPYCSPTRAGLLAGRYQQRFGHEFNPALLAQGGAGQGLSPREVTIADRLKAAGYATGLVGKWHLGQEEQFHPLNRGFGEFYGFLPGAHSYLISNDKTRGPILRGRERVEIDGYLTDVLAREAAGFIDRHQKEPFFLYLAFNAVHTPMQAPAALLKQFAHIQDPTRRTYLAMTAALDAAVGKVLDKLRTAGLEEQTLVFFLSDNGGPIGKFASNGSTNTPLRGSKGDTWEGGVRVPFVVQWKGKLPAGKVYEHPVIQLDIYRTALAAAGIQAAPAWKLDGVNLLPYLDGKNPAPPHEALYWRFGPQMALRKGDWKLVRADLDPKRQFGKVAERPMLFNLAQDIGEKNDLAAREPAKVKELLEQWQTWNARLVPASWNHHGLQKTSQKPIDRGLRIIGHRGLIHHAPENTLAGFAACVELRLGFELDIRRTGDGHLVCLHDDDVQRTTDGSGRVAELTLAELRKLDAGARFTPAFPGERVPTLEEVFALVRDRSDGQTLVALDLKVRDDSVEADVVRLAKLYGIFGQVVCIGHAIGEPAVRRKLRAADAATPVAVLAQTANDLSQAMREPDADWVYLRFVPTREQVAQVHQTGKRVFLTGPAVMGHETDSWLRARAAGVDALLTDFPLECRQAKGKQ